MGRKTPAWVPAALLTSYVTGDNVVCFLVFKRRVTSSSWLVWGLNTKPSTQHAERRPNSVTVARLAVSRARLSVSSSEELGPSGPITPYGWGFVICN